MDLKKEIYLGIAAVALYAAAREYGIHNLSDAKRKLGPYLKWFDLVDALTQHQNQSHKKTTQALHSRGNHASRDGHSEGGNGGRPQKSERSGQA
jgi:hypothetical protein